MPGHPNYFDEDVYLDWEKLAFGAPGLSHEGSRLAWRALFAKTYVDGQWTCKTTSAALVTSMGVTQALIDHRPADGEELARLFLRFDRQICDRIDWDIHWVHLGSCLLLQGREAEAIDHWSRYEPLRTMDRTHVRLITRNGLQSCFNEMGHAMPASPGMRRFVANLVSQFRGKKRVSLRAEAAVTLGELATLLDETYPKRDAPSCRQSM